MHASPLQPIIGADRYRHLIRRLATPRFALVRALEDRFFVVAGIGSRTGTTSSTAEPFAETSTSTSPPTASVSGRLRSAGAKPSVRDCSTMPRRSRRSASRRVIAQRVVGHDVGEHLAHLAHQVDRLVEGQDEVALGELDRLADLDHRRPAAPGARRAVEGRVVALGDEEPVVALLAEDGVLEVLQPAAQQDQVIGQREVVGVAEVAVEAEPGEDLGQILRRAGGRASPGRPARRGSGRRCRRRRRACRPWRSGSRGAGSRSGAARRGCRG